MDLLFGITFALFLLVFLICLLWPISIPLTIYYIYKKNKMKKHFKSAIIDSKSYNDIYRDIDPKKLAGFDITDIEKLKVFLFDIFNRFEKAYNSLDYNTMYNLSTSSLYTMYHTNMLINSKFNEKKIIEAVELKKMYIYDAYASTQRHTIRTVIEMSNISYTQNSNGKIISGSPTEKQIEKFEVTFVKILEGKKDYRCPNCGANVSGTTCDYCKSTINDCNFRISSIKKII